MATEVLQSQKSAGGYGGAVPSETPPSTTFNLLKPSDLNMVVAAVVRGWDIPEHLRKQICDHIGPAMDELSWSQDHRAPQRFSKLINLAVLMDAQNLVDEAVLKSSFPQLRNRPYRPFSHRCPVKLRA